MSLQSGNGFSLKQIGDAKWSRTHNAWQIPYTQEAFNQLKNLFPDIEYRKKKNELETGRAIVIERKETATNKDVSVEILKKRLMLKMAKTKRIFNLYERLNMRNGTIANASRLY